MARHRSDSRVAAAGLALALAVAPWGLPRAGAQAPDREREATPPPPPTVTGEEDRVLMRARVELLAIEHDARREQVANLHRLIARIELESAGLGESGREASPLLRERRARAEAMLREAQDQFLAASVELAGMQRRLESIEVRARRTDRGPDDRDRDDEGLTRDQLADTARRAEAILRGVDEALRERPGRPGEPATEREERRWSDIIRGLEALVEAVRGADEPEPRRPRPPVEPD